MGLEESASGNGEEWEIPEGFRCYLWELGGIVRDLGGTAGS